MSLTPFQQYLQNQAAKVKEESGHGSVLDSLSAQMIEQLSEHKTLLGNIQSIEAKAARKAELFSEYQDYLEGALEADTGDDDPIVKAWLLWSADIDNWAMAVRLAAYAERHDLGISEQFKRSPATFLVDSISDKVIASAPEKYSELDIDLTLLAQVFELAEQDNVRPHIPDQAFAKLHKAAGLLAVAEQTLSSLNKARAHWQHAIQLDKRVGLVKRLEQLEREIISHPDASGSPDDAAQAEQGA